MVRRAWPGRWRTRQLPGDASATSAVEPAGDRAVAGPRAPDLPPPTGDGHAPAADLIVPTGDARGPIADTTPGAPPPPADALLPAGVPDPLADRARWRWRALLVELLLVACWVALSFLLCYVVAVDTRSTRLLSLVVAVLLASISALVVVAVLALRRAADRQLRSGLREASASLRSIEALTDPDLWFLPLDQLLEALLARTHEALGGDVVSVLLADEDHRVLRVRAAAGATELAPVGTEVPFGDGMVGTAAQWTRPVVVDRGDEGQASPHGPAAPGRDFGSLVAAPLVVRGTVIGVIEVGSRERRSFDRNRLRLLQVVADRCAASIERARLDDAERRSRLGAQHAHLHLGLLARGAAALSTAFTSYDQSLGDLGDVVVPDFADWFAADFFDESGELRQVAVRWGSRGLVIGQAWQSVPHRHRRGDALVRQAIADQRPQVVMRVPRARSVDVDAAVHLPETPTGSPLDVESMMIVPVVVRGTCAGALSFVTGPGRRGYRPSDLESAKELAGRVGVAIDRVASWRASQLAGDAVRRHAERLEELVEAGLVVNAELAAEEVVDLLAEHAHRVLEAEVVVVVSALPGGSPVPERVWPPGALDGPETQRRRELRAAVSAAAGAVVRTGQPSRWPVAGTPGTDGEGDAERGGERGGEADADAAAGSRWPAPHQCWLAAPLTDSAGECRRVVVAIGAPADRRARSGVDLLAGAGPGSASGTRLGAAAGPRPRSFSSEDESVLMLLAQMASVALQNAGLYADVRRDERRLEAVVNSSPLAIAELDLSGAVRWWNRAATELFGWSEGGPYRLRTRDNSELVLAGLWERARAGKATVGIAVSSADPDGRPLELSLSTSPLIEDDRVTGVLLVADDVTERQRILQQFHQAERLSAMARMAGALAHDFNNLLTVILGCSDVLLRAAGGNEPLAREASAIQRAGERAAALTSRLVGIGDQRPVQPEAVSLDEVIASMEPMLAGLLGNNVTVDLSRRAGRASILIDRGELERALLNLAVNARDAMPDGGHFVIRTRRGPPLDGDGRPTVLLSCADTGAGMDPDTAAHCFEPFFTTKGRAQGTGLGLATVHAVVTRAGGEVQVDSVPGRGTRFTMRFPLHRQADRTEPGAPPGPAALDGPTPGPGAGDGDLAGNGVFTAAGGGGAAGNANGSGVLTGRGGNGSSAGEGGASGDAGDDHGPLPVRGEPDLRTGAVVLLVEDEPEVRRLAARELEERGYVVVVAADGTQALQAMHAREGDVGILVTDVVMPGMNGIDLAHAVTRRYPRVPVLFLSGHLDHEPGGHSTLPDGSLLLAKPFTPAELAARVRQVLARRASPPRRRATPRARRSAAADPQGSKR